MSSLHGESEFLLEIWIFDLSSFNNIRRLVISASSLDSFDWPETRTDLLGKTGELSRDITVILSPSLTLVAADALL